MNTPAAGRSHSQVTSSYSNFSSSSSVNRSQSHEVRGRTDFRYDKLNSSRNGNGDLNSSINGHNDGFMQRNGNQNGNQNEDNLFSEVDTADLGPDCDVHLWDPEHVRAWLIGNHLGDLSSKLYSALSYFVFSCLVSCLKLRFAWSCVVLCCIVLHYIALYYIAFYWIVLCCIVLHYIALHFVAFYCIA